MQTTESLPRRIINARWWLFTACAILLFIVSYGVAVTQTQTFWSPAKRELLLALFTSAGPFGASVANWLPLSEPVSWIFGLPCLLLMFLHPVKPRTLTAIITAIGFMVWLFMGIVMIYVAV